MTSVTSIELCAAEETVRRELPPEDRPALTRLSPLTDGALSLRPPTLRRPCREAELLTQLQQLAVALDGACPLVLDGSCGSHVTPSALLAPGELDAAASTTGLLAVSEWSCVPVGGWLRSLGLAQYADAFVARSVDGARLLGLTEQAMEDEPDIAGVLGLGFPPLTGGPFRFVDRIGPAQLVKDMERFAVVSGVGFEPCLTVHYQAASGTKFCSAGPRHVTAAGRDDRGSANQTTPRRRITVGPAVLDLASDHGQELG
ncbi:Fatty acid oxidation complex subunit alpha [Amphibalanus amphitrite]|uniref:Fatty acid oxidation complex subunit alpha n=1 Tax=Amphibalanus amphitrite TaxID=1232801 RepID=A0A6A4W9P7_AMPAM|nr:Fatty acid oxidation complex subunit alpha [Amphibalanus amphitrite]